MRKALALLLLALAAPAYPQAVSLTGDARVKLPAVGGVRYTNPTSGANAAPFCHAVGDSSSPFDGTLALQLGTSFTLNIFQYCSDPEERPFTLSAGTCSWPTGVTADYNTGIVSASSIGAVGSGSCTVNLIDSPHSVPYTFDWTVTTPDSTAPTAPSACAVTAVTSTSPYTVTIACNASTDASGIATYQLYRCDTAACASPSLRSTSATPTFSAQPGNSARYYHVTATDAAPAANESSRSNEVFVDPNASTPVTLLHDDDFEAFAAGATSALDNAVYNISTDGSGEPTVVSSPALAGSRSLRNQVLAASAGGACTDGNAGTACGQFRSELRLVNAMDTMSMQGREVYYGVRVRLSTGFASSPPGGIVFQLHDATKNYGGDDASDDKASVGKPMLALLAVDGRWRLTFRWNASQPTTGSTSEVHYWLTGNYVVDQTYDFQFYVKWDWTSAGRVKAWCQTNGANCSGAASVETPIVDYSGPVGYHDDRMGYVKFGGYWAACKTVDCPNLTIYHDEVKIAGSDGSRSAVAP